MTGADYRSAPLKPFQLGYDWRQCAGIQSRSGDRLKSEKKGDDWLPTAHFSDLERRESICFG
jgi:hypothetical protein